MHLIVKVALLGQFTIYIIWRKNKAPEKYSLTDRSPLELFEDLEKEKLQVSKSQWLNTLEGVNDKFSLCFHLSSGYQIIIELGAGQWWGEMQQLK